jgi:hypothetical protein
MRLDEVPEAHRLVDSGRKRGNIVVLFDYGAPEPVAQCFFCSHDKE